MQTYNMRNIMMSLSFVKSTGAFMFLLVGLFVSKPSTAQIPSNSNGILPNVIPASSEAASLGKFGEWPVSQYIGVPNINIPIYTIKTGGFELPIQLSYHAGGIKVDEMSSWVGSGWALSGGGMVSRTIVGLPDEEDWLSSVGQTSNGTYQKLGGLYLENKTNGTNFLKNSYNLSDANTFTFFSKVAQGLADSEPDIFYLNIGNISSKFYIDPSGNPRFIPANNIKILASPFSTSSPSALSWSIADDKGNTYYFGSNNAFEKTYSGPVPAPNGGSVGEFKRVTSWYVTQIITANKADTIYFDYTQKYEAYWTEPVMSYKAYSLLSGGINTARRYIGADEVADLINANKILYDGSPVAGYHSMSMTSGATKLAGIRWRGGAIRFTSTTDRQDMPTTTSLSTMLDSVTINNYSGTIVKSLRLKYSYINNRYFLNSLTEYGQAGSQPLAHTFSYISPEYLPAKGSYAQDHWGFFNGKGNTTLLPSTTLMPPQTNVYLTANREPDSAAMQYGTLNKITYPTGGYSLFSYEPNRYAGSVPGAPAPPAPIVNIGLNVATASSPPYYRSVTFQVPFDQTNASINIKFVNYGRPAIAANMSPNPYVSLYQQGVNGTFQRVNYWNAFDIYSTLPAISPNANGFYDYNYWMYNLTLRAGTYIITASDSCKAGECDQSPMPKAEATLNYSGYGQTSPGGGTAPLPLAGGLRIKQMLNYNGDGSYVNGKRYSYSPGNLLSYPNYVFQQAQDITSSVFESTDPLVLTDCGPYFVKYWEETSSSHTILGFTQGSIVGYSQVTEKDIDATGNDKGYAVYNFSFTPDSLNVFNFDSYWGNMLIMNPLNPSNTFDFKRGLLLGKDVFKKNSDGSYIKLQSIVNDYNYNDYNATNLYSRIRGVRVQHMRIPSGPGGNYYCSPIGTILPPNNAVFSPDFGYSVYDLITSWVQNISTTETNYDQNGQNPLTKITKTFYDNPKHLQPTRSVTTRSNGDSLVSLINYPQDYAVGTPFIDSLVAHNIISIPIENVNYKVDPSINRNILSGKIMTFKPDGKGLLDKIRIMESIPPIPLSSFKFSNVGSGLLPYGVGIKSVFSPDSKYADKVVVSGYDGYSNTTEQYKLNDAYNSYVWDYNKMYPIAQTTNATQSNIAHTSFEAEGKGNWTYAGTPAPDITAPTGKKAFTIVGIANNITKSGLGSTGTYIVSYWKKSGTVAVNGTTPITGKTINGWTYYEHKVVNPAGGLITVSGTSGVIDELRLYPSTAQMTTYTYDPLIGMTTQCDPNNKITYYEYDGFGRLKTIRDQDKNVIKTLDYQYQKTYNQ